MYKSVFTKYMMAFAVIIFISFLLLAFIISSIINVYAVNSVKQDVKSSSSVAVDVIGHYYEEEHAQDFSTFTELHSDVFGKLCIGLLENLDKGVFFLTDPTGDVLLGVNKEGEMPVGKMANIPESVMTSLLETGTFETNGHLEGFFSERVIISGEVVYDTEGNVIGAVFACASASSEVALSRVMSRTVILASIWVMLAAMIAVYFISDRITSPLRSMKLAAKEFAKGKMDTRVTVQGQDEVAELGVAFNHMAEALQENERMRNSFLANVSHDLRTPMTTIAGFVDGMISGAIPPEKQPEYLEIVSSEVHRLSRLVSQILDISRLESGERKFVESTFDVCEMARLILISFEQKIEEKRLEVEFLCERDSMMASADKDAIHQVLYNLCDNAIKFANVGGVFRIQIAPTTEGKLCVSVYNQGQGIPEEDLPHIFERFYKSDKSRGLDKRGVGLGLYIVKTILEAQQQTVTVNSKAGEWCEFKFTLKQG